jgi:hypothetical protein
VDRKEGDVGMTRSIFGTLTVRGSVKGREHPSAVSRNRHLKALRRVELSLPGFLVEALDCLIRKANASAEDGQPDMDLAEYLTIHLVDMLDEVEIVELDRDIPGFRDALNTYLLRPLLK